MTLIRRALIKTIKNVMLVTFALVVLQEKGFTQELTIASYNIRYANKDDSLKGNAWSNRAPVIAQLIEFHDFDIFGTQEGLHRQLEDLKKLAPVYDYIGKGRDDGDKKGSSLLFFIKRTSLNYWIREIFGCQQKPNIPIKDGMRYFLEFVAGGILNI